MWRAATSGPDFQTSGLGGPKRGYDLPRYCPLTQLNTKRESCPAPQSAGANGCRSAGGEDGRPRLCLAQPSTLRYLGRGPKDPMCGYVRYSTLQRVVAFYNANLTMVEATEILPPVCQKRRRPTNGLPPSPATLEHGQNRHTNSARK